MQSVGRRRSAGDPRRGLALAQETAVVGETPSMAARLQALASRTKSSSARPRTRCSASTFDLGEKMLQSGPGQLVVNENNHETTTSTLSRSQLRKSRIISPPPSSNLSREAR